MRAGRIYEGDEYIAGDDGWYRVVSVDAAACIAVARYLGSAGQDGGALYRELRAKDAVFLDLVVDAALTAYARRVNEVVLHAVSLERSVDRVAGRAGYIGDDEPLVAEDAVDERALARVRLADDGDVYDVLVLL